MEELPAIVRLRNEKRKVDKDYFFHKEAASNYAVKNHIYSKEAYRKSYADYRYAWNNINSNISANPLCIDIEVASYCDLGCPFCYRQQVVTPDKLISDELAVSVVQQAIELNVESIKFNWRGEPLLNPRLEKYIEQAKKGGTIETLINTNALSLTTERSENLIKAGLDTLIYSFDGGSKETYEKNRPGRFKNNKFEDIIENIRKFNEVKKALNSPFPFTRIQMILTEETRKELDDFISIFSNIVDEVSVKQYTERGGNISVLSKKERELLQNYCDINNLDINTVEFMVTEGKVYVSKSRIPCKQPFQRLLVTYEGRVGMCCYDWGATYPVGVINKEQAIKAIKDYQQTNENINVKKKGFEMMKPIINQDFKALENLQSDQKLIDIWNGSKISDVRKKQIELRHEEISICKNCKFKETYKWAVLS